MAVIHSVKKKAIPLLALLTITLVLVGVLAAGCGASEQNASLDTSSGSGVIVNTIIVTGTGRAMTLPDKASIQVAVQNDGATAAAALDANSKDMQKVLDRLKAEGVPDSAIETANVVVYPNRYYDQSTGQEKTTGYRAENSVTVTFEDLTVIGDIYAAVIEAGADNVWGPSWELSDDNPAMATALTRAIAMAESKAEAIAADQGLKLGDAIIISESAASQPYPIYDRAAAEGMGGDSSITVPPINPQNMEVTASVTVTYRMSR